MNDSLCWAEQFVDISAMEKAIINVARKTFLFHKEEIWIKPTNEDAFDIPQGCLDGAEDSDLVGLYMLNKIKSELPYEINAYGLYRDDFLALVSGTGPQINRIKKKIK